LLETLFPKFCVNCKTEGFYLCPDCFSLIEILDRQYCAFCQKAVFDGKTCQNCFKNKHLKGLFCATSYDNFIIRKLINYFKYEPFVKDIAKTLSYLIITHISLAAKGDFSLNFADFINSVLIPVPSYKKKQKYRGFNPAEEITKHLAEYLKIPILNDALIKTKQTLAQTELKKEQRIENIKGVFGVKNPEKIKNKKIILIDDVLTTGSTLEECAKILKTAGAKEVWGMVAARG